MVEILNGHDRNRPQTICRISTNEKNATVVHADSDYGVNNRDCGPNLRYLMMIS